MALFGLFKKRHTFDDSDRALAYERRNMRLKLDMQRMEDEARITRARADREEARLKAEMSEYLSGDEENDLGSLLTAFMPILQRAFPNAFSGTNPTLPLSETGSDKPVSVSYSNEQLLAYKQKIPSKYLKLAKAMPDEQLKQIIKQNVLHNADEDSLNRSIQMIRQ